MTTVLGEPWTTLAPNTNQTLTGNEQFVGYIPDLTRELSLELGFNYSLELVADGQYGANNSGTWTGMVGELVAGRADVAAADLRVASKRMSAVDFTQPFMTFGAGVIKKKGEQ